MWRQNIILGGTMQLGNQVFERVALLLQGGGALGAYQGGVYQALAEADLHPNCVSGISIGAINAALIAGNAPSERVVALRAFWEKITEPPLGFPYISALFGAFQKGNDQLHGYVNQMHALVTAANGVGGFFKPRYLPPLLAASSDSLYDTGPLRETLEGLIDFDRLNSGETWFSVGAVNVRSGNFKYFDSTECRIEPEHIMASGALPPSFPAVEIDGEYYWDGGVVSNTPLSWVLQSHSRKDTLAFQVDLWKAGGELPRTMVDIDLRQKDIRYSSRTRANTDQFREMQRARRAVHRLLAQVPDISALPEEERRLLASVADEKVYNIAHLIYRAKTYEGSSKDYEFSRESMEEHWASGYRDALATLKHPEILQRPTATDGVSIFDLGHKS